MLFAYGSNHLGVFVEPFFVCSCFSYLFLNRLAAIVLFFFVPHSFESLIRHSLENCIDHSLLMSFSSGSFLKQWTSWCFAGFSGHLDENYKEVSVIKKKLNCFLVLFFDVLCDLSSVWISWFIKYLERHWVLGTKYRNWRAWATPTIWITRLDWQVVKF